MKIIKKDRVINLYESIDCGEEFIKKYKEVLENEIDKMGDKSVYFELKEICQRDTKETIVIVISVIAAIIALADCASAVFDEAKYVSIGLFVICAVAAAFLASITLWFMKKRLPKYRMTDLILDEIYKEKFEK